MSNIQTIKKDSQEALGFLNIIMEKLKIASVFVLDKNGLITDINSGARKAFGYSHEDVVGKHFSILFIDEDVQKNMPQKELEEVLKEGSAKDYNYLKHKNGEHVWVNGESILIVDENGEPHITKVVFDVTEQKNLEKSLMKNNEKLEKINKDMDTFVYTASHDLKAPISNVQALIHALYDELPQEIKEKESIKEIMEMLAVSINKFQVTISDLAIIGKVESGKIDDLSSIAFHDVLEDVKQNLQEAFDAADPVINEDFSKAPQIKFSKQNIRSILQNLISNAIKYRSSDRKPVINISTEKCNNNFILLKISDNGIGIKDTDKEKVFSIYERIHTHIEGTGVGMSIVKRIVDNNGGNIELESELGKGSTFKVYLKEDGD